MRHNRDRLSRGALALLAFISVGLLLFLVGFLLWQSLPALREVGLKGLLDGEWRPVIYGDAPSYGLRNMLLTTLYVSALALALALVIGVGCSLFLVCSVSDRLRSVLLPALELLAGIPSVVYGFVGLYVVVRTLEKLGRPAGESILAGALVLSVMILPYIISTCTSSMLQLRRRYESASAALGTSRWYMASQLILPASGRAVLASAALAAGRAMGETMAVMMVIGNAPIPPRLLGKGETVAALIALEMGTAEVGSLHCSALYAAGLGLLGLLLGVNLIVALLRRKLRREGIL